MNPPCIYRQRTRLAAAISATGFLLGGCSPSNASGEHLACAVIALTSVAAIIFILRSSRKLRRQLEKHARELETSEERHRLLLAQASDAILVADADTGVIIEANLRANELLGWAGTELVGQRQTTVHQNSERDLVRRAFIEHRKRGGIVDEDTVVMHRSGEHIPVNARSTLVTAGSQRFMQVILRDLRPRLRAEEALRRSEARQRELLEHAPVSIIEEDFSAPAAWLGTLGVQNIHDLSEYLKAHPQELAKQFARIQIVSANPAALRAAGAPDLESYRARMPSTVTPSVLDAFRLELEAVWQGRTEVTCELTFRRYDGTLSHGVLHWSVNKIGDRPDLSRVVVAISDLTPLRTAEARLREVEDRWELAVRGLNAGIFEQNYLTGETYLSDRWKEIIGYLPHEFPAHREAWQSRVHPEDRTRVLAAMHGHLRRQLPSYQVDYRILCKDGSYKWIEARGRAIFNTDGQPVRFIGAHADISDRKAAEVALRESETRYRVLFEQSPVAIVELDYSVIGTWQSELRERGVTDLAAHMDKNPDELARMLTSVKIVHCNRETLRMVRAATKDELSEKIQRVFTPDAYASRKQTFLALWEGRSEVEGEVTLMRLDGAPRRVFFRWWMPPLEGGSVISHTQIVLVDLTDIRTTEAELAAERERLRVTLRAMAEGLLTTDNGGIVQFMNEAAERMTGWTAGSAIGRHVDEICLLRHEKSRTHSSLPLNHSIAEHRVVEFPLQALLAGRNNLTCQVDGRCAPMYDLSGRAIGAVAVFRDVTERARLEAELLRSSKLESVGILAGGIAHDFNNILTVVMGNVTLAMLDSTVNESVGRWLEEAERGVLRARDLTQQLLTFAKGGDPVRKTVRLPEVVREAAEFALHGSKVRCEFSVAPDLWAADVDKGQIGQVVQNLVINAVQAMPEGGVIRVSICNDPARPPATPGLLPDGSYLRLSITDSGMGIRADHIARIFDPYFTTKQSGSGLGLATVYSIVRKHKGHIEVDSELGKGTTFNIWLPAAPEAEPAAPESATEIIAMSGRVLFMDDETTICTLAKTLLTRIGFTVTTQPDGAAAVAAYREAREKGEPFRLVIMDLTVPGGMGGLEAMQALLAYDPSVIAIVSSGYSSDPVMAHYRKHGFRGMAPKPYKITDLARTIRTVLQEA
jgi:PAS domain S-box-containing protein